LCKEIAYQWSQGKVLTETKFLFLLLACEQTIQSLKQVKDMIRHYCHLESEETVDLVYKHIEETDGATLTILLDGYDELSEEFLTDHLLSYIIRREIFPKCSVIITSRSFACGSCVILLIIDMKS